ncbi:MAG: GC-type dockerin domain-anchored protein [Phycisphaerales bacterium JB041]
MTTRIAAVLGLCACAAASAQTFSLAIDPNASGFTGTLGLEIDTAGTLVGDWDPDTNPEGTRTKPGVFGSFGSTENLPVAADLGFSLAGDLETQTAGGATLTLDLDSGVVTLEGLVADLLAGGTASVPATIGIAPESFRTRQPDSVYIGVPIDVPFGELNLTALSLTQTGAAVGVLTEIETDRFSFVLAGLAEISGGAELLGTAVEIPALPTPLALSGEIVLDGETLTLTSLQPIDQTDEQTPGTEIPEFPLGLPTILPPGETANVVLSLVLDRVATGLVGELALAATGELALCPGDFNGDGAVDTRDVLSFLNAWAAGEGRADANEDGVVDTRDVLFFLNLWTAGC